jgi:lauroyl/myristoyl acyltransferase
MLSPQDWVQEVAALVVAGAAALYLVRRLVGWPRRRKLVRPTGRLGAGLSKARRRRALRR